MRRPRPLALALLLSASAFILAACIGGLDPDGGWAAPVVSGDDLYLGAKDGRLTRFALDENGRFDNSWGFPATGLDTLGPIYGTPRVDGDRVFAAAYDCDGLDCDAQIFAVSTLDGSPLWPEVTFKLRTTVVGAVAVAGDTVLFGTAEIDDEFDLGESEGYLYALDARPEAPVRLLWRFPTEGAVWGTPVVSDGVVYFGDLDGVFYAVSLGSDDGTLDGAGSNAGRELWRFKAGGAVVAEPLIVDGMIYFGDFSDTFYALDIATREAAGSGSVLQGLKEWSFNSDGWFWAKPILHDNILYVGTLNGKFYALDPDTGAERWAKPGVVQGQIVGSAAVINVISVGSALAVPSGKDNIGVFDARNGAELNGFATKGGVKASLIVNEDFLYVHTTDDDLITFRIADRSVISCVEAETGVACN